MANTITSDRLVLENVIREFPDVEFNLHLHTKSSETESKIKAAYDAGCRNFDTVYNGMGGCPMTGDEPIANLNTCDFINWLKVNNMELSPSKIVSLSSRV